ncbi:MAG: hypothetical protein KC620_02810 [Myxococcales bacterium]|nr:hypothetical protein [Myxococcales bacterium]
MKPTAPARRVVALALLFIAAGAAPAAADMGGWFAAGLGARHAFDVDLARLADAKGYGSANDGSPASLGLALSGGFIFNESIEVGVRAELHVGGLDLAAIEKRYFGDEDNVGSALTTALELMGRVALPLTEELDLIAGGAAGYTLLSAASGVGSGRIEGIGIGPQVGLRYRVNGLPGQDSGHLQLTLDGRYLIPWQVKVGSGDTAKFDDTSGEGVLLAGGVLSYVFAFR